MDIKDWRCEESRRKIVDKILDTLKRYMPQRGPDGMYELEMIALRFEDKIFKIAVNQKDYLQTIAIKMLSLGSNGNQPSGNHILGSSFGNNQWLRNPAAEGNGREGVYGEWRQLDQPLDDQSLGEIEMVIEGRPPLQGIPVETIQKALRILFLSYLPRDAPDPLVPDALAELGVPDAALAPALQVLETLRHQECRIAELEGELRGLRAVLSKSRWKSNQKITSELEGGGSSAAHDGEGSVL